MQECFLGFCLNEHWIPVYWLQNQIMAKGSMDGSIGCIVCVNYWLLVIVCSFMKCLVASIAGVIFLGVTLFHWYLEIFFEWFVIDKFNRRMIGLQIFRFDELCNRARLQKVDSTFNLTFKLRKPLLLERAIRYISKYCWVVFINSCKWPCVTCQQVAWLTHCSFFSFHRLQFNNG